MTAIVLLDTLCARGVTVEPRGDRLRIRPASALIPEELQALQQYKTEVRLILDYRASLLEFWRLNAAGPEVTQAVAVAAYNEVVRLIDEVGEPTASTLRHQWEREWHQKTGRCPRCGELGERHA